MIEALYGIQSTFSESAAHSAPAVPAAHPSTPPHRSTAGAGSQSSGEDTVTLSASAQASQLLQAGESVSQIAAQLGTTTSTVDIYLGITEASVPSVSTTAGSSVLQFGPTASLLTQRVA